MTQKMQIIFLDTGIINLSTSRNYMSALRRIHYLKIDAMFMVNVNEILVERRIYYGYTKNIKTPVF